MQSNSVPADLRPSRPLNFGSFSDEQARADTMPLAPPTALAADTCAGRLAAGGDSDERWAEAERNMAALGATVATATRLLDGAVYLDSAAKGAALSKQQLSSSLVGQQRRIQQLTEELESTRAAAEASRRAQEAAEARLRDAARLIATLKGEVANGKTALQAHVAELLRLQAERQAAPPPPS